MSRKTLLLNSALTLAVSTALCLVVLAASAWSSNAGINRQSSTEITDATGAFQIVSATPERNAIQLVLRNISTRRINAYSISLDGASRIGKDFTRNGTVIEPEGTDELLVPSGSSPPRNITIITAVFDDDTFAGDAQVAESFIIERQGVRIQTQRILALLRNYLATAESRASLAGLYSQLSALPTQPEVGESPHIGAGLHSAKEEILHIVRELMDTGQEVESGQARRRLARVAEGYERRMSRR